MEWYNAMEESFEEITILGIPALFTPNRIKRSTIPHGYHLYDVRHREWFIVESEKLLALGGVA